MELIPREIANQFVGAFAGNNIGFSAIQIKSFFKRYSALAVESNSYGFTQTRADLFINLLYSLQPKQQYYALTDLTRIIHESKNEYPTDDQRAYKNPESPDSIRNDCAPLKNIGPADL